MLLEKLNSNQNTHSTTLECPNCWGHQEWNGRICDIREKRVNLYKDGFILAFVKRYINRPQRA